MRGSKIAFVGLALGFYLGSASAHGAGVVSALAVSVVGQAGEGTVKGRLVWGGDTVPASVMLVEKGKAAKDPEVCANDTPIASKELVVDPATKGVSFGFAYILRPKGTNPAAVKALLAKTPKVVVDQKNCEFEPYVLAMHREQTLVFKSSDAASHNVRFTGFNNTGINQTLAPAATFELKNLKAERLPMKLLCDIHPWMKGWIMVFDHPFFATTAADGSFEITGIPAGQQNLVLWQEKVGYATPGAGRGVSVTIKAGATTDLGEIKIDPAKIKK